MKKYNVSLHGNVHQAIVEAKDKETAELYARWEFGNSNVDYVRLATEEELAWHQAMDGEIHQAQKITMAG